MRIITFVALTSIGLAGLTATANAACSDLPDHAALTSALKASVKPSGGPSNGGLDLNMWATIVDLDGTVCAVTFSGGAFTDQWLGSRVISAQKANTANAFSLDGLALSTANLFSAVQPGASLFGLQESNPVDTDVAYGGNSDDFGQGTDPMVGERVGGVNVFGGGLALYGGGKKVGAVGVSGDTSCADHNIAWRVRQELGLGTVPGGVNPNGDDGIIYDISNGMSAGGFGHATCGGGEVAVATEMGAGSSAE
ncbi:MAG: heme-binding protein [Hyphomicrobiales bacterium]|nr:heme-binding protein [Hyphomicrobiales bacterium]